MRKYAEQAKVFCKAVTIAEKIMRNSKEHDAYTKTTVINSYKSMISLVEHAEKGMATLRSLAQLENEFLTYWNEGVGEDVDLFWQRLEAAGINYKRNNLFDNVLKNKKIRNFSEYSTVIDGLVIAQQMGKITEEDAVNLNNYIAAYEKRSRR